jgi:hypothetical protein
MEPILTRQGGSVSFIGYSKRVRVVYDMVEDVYARCKTILPIDNYTGRYGLPLSRLPRRRLYYTHPRIISGSP